MAIITIPQSKEAVTVRHCECTLRATKQQSVAVHIALLGGGLLLWSVALYSCCHCLNKKVAAPAAAAEK